MSSPSGSPSRWRRWPGWPTTTAGPGCPAAPSCSRRSTRSASSCAARTRCGCSRRPRPRRCAAAADDPTLLERAAALEGAARRGAATPGRAAAPAGRAPVAFLCAEYGVHASLPVYSGGLGALAGDLLKEASDRALPFVAVGLMYRKGYFRQRIDGGGWQHEYWVDTDPERLPAALVTGDDGAPLTISLPIGDADVAAQIWRVDVGRVPLYLLDTDMPENGPMRALDHRAPVRRRRANAPGAVRAARGRRNPALEALGIEPGDLTSTRATPRWPRSSWPARPRAPATAGDRARRRLDSGPCSPPTRRSRPATTPTRPRSRSRTRSADRRLVGPRRRGDRRSAAPTPTTSGQPFGVTQAALRLSRAANAVSAPPRRGRARDVAALWPDRPVGDVPIGHVTNGVHFPTWIGRADARAAGPPPRRRLAAPRRRPADLGRRRRRSPTRSCGTSASASAPSSCRSCAQRSLADRLARGDSREYVEAAARAFDPARADDRLRPTRGDLQAARAADARSRLDPVAAGRRVSGAGRAGRQGASPRRGGQALAAGAVRPQARADHRRARRVPGRLRPGHRRPAGARLRRVAEPAAPAAGGQRHQRDEGRDQRRRCSSACSTAGGRRPTTGTTAGGSPATSTPITTPRTSATPPRCTECSSEEVLPAFYDRDERDLPRRLAPADARLAAHARPAVLRHADARPVRRGAVSKRSVGNVCEAPVWGRFRGVAASLSCKQKPPGTDVLFLL